MARIYKGEVGKRELNNQILGRQYKAGVCWFCQLECEKDSYFHQECYDME